MRRLVVVAFIITPMLSYSFISENKKSFAPIIDEDEPRVEGYIDANGKQGWWTVYGKDYPERGYPMDGKIEEGNYKDDRKVGEWIMYHLDGVTPKCIGTFVDGRPNGVYKKMNTQGIVIEEGDFYNKKQRGKFITYYDDGTPKQIKNFNDDGKEEGNITFFFEDGTVQYKGSAVNGIPVGEAIKYWPDGIVNEILSFGPNGEVINTKVVNAEPPLDIKVETGSGGPDGTKGLILDGNSFKPDGYNIVYNKNKELWMEGTFKNSKLWNGKLYKYDEEGILLKFELWKNGAYHSDGQL